MKKNTPRHTFRLTRYNVVYYISALEHSNKQKKTFSNEGFNNLIDKSFEFYYRFRDMGTDQFSIEKKTFSLNERNQM